MCKALNNLGWAIVGDLTRVLHYECNENRFGIFCVMKWGKNTIRIELLGLSNVNHNITSSLTRIVPAWVRNILRSSCRLNIHSTTAKQSINRLLKGRKQIQYNWNELFLFYSGYDILVDWSWAWNICRKTHSASFWSMETIIIVEIEFSSRKRSQRRKRWWWSWSKLSFRTFSCHYYSDTNRGNN